MFIRELLIFIGFKQTDISKYDMGVYTIYWNDNMIYFSCHYCGNSIMYFSNRTYNEKDIICLINQEFKSIIRKNKIKNLL